MAQKLVVIGNGMAPGRALERLFKLAPDAYEVTIFNAEPRTNYDRILLSPVLSGEKSYEEIVIHGDDWYEKNGVTLHKGKKVSQIDRAAKTVMAEDGTLASYDKLLIATGSLPFIIPVPGRKLPGVLTYRDLDDVNAMMIAAEQGGCAVVIGGGLLGLEAAAGLKQRGMDVTVIHLGETLMNRQLDFAAGQLLKRTLESRGIKVITKANTKQIMATHPSLGGQKVRAVALEDGTEIAADIVVMAVGIRPNAHLAKDAGLDTNRGILVDDKLQTSDPDIMAVGECVEFDGNVYGLVAPLFEQAKIAATKLAGEACEGFVDKALATKLKVTGVDLFSAGDFAKGGEREEIVLRDVGQGVYRRLVLEDDKLIGVVMFGDTSDSGWFFDLIKDETNIAGMRETLIFGPAYVADCRPAAPVRSNSTYPATRDIAA
ncbi:MAG: FAD-dependent oxidoreductase [Alphaproteobacteria bacterium]|nr:FAD-dependent oxidoreductase [Alphaproteobacteria bacterium]